jgi:antitoxin PrlF
MTTKECCNKECCRIDAIVTVDAKGQIVLPKDLREKAKIKPNDKLAVIGFQRGSEEVCCIVMLKVDALDDTVKNLLGPVFKNVFQPEGVTQ